MRIGNSWNGCNALLPPCSWRKWNGTACLPHLQTRADSPCNSIAIVMPWLGRWGSAVVQVQVPLASLPVTRSQTRSCQVLVVRPSEQDSEFLRRQPGLLRVALERWSCLCPLVAGFYRPPLWTGAAATSLYTCPTIKIKGSISQVLIFKSRQNGKI